MSRLIDVARAAGVSRSTVSNVYNNPELVRPELRARVAEAARALNYTGPDVRGRLLRSGKFNALGVMAPADWGTQDALRNPVFHQFLLGVAEICDNTGTSMLIVPHGAGGHSLNTALVDGFIFGQVEHMAQIEPARLHNRPFAVVDFDPGPDINAVQVDARRGAHAAAVHLLALGHRRFGILSFLREFGPARLYAPGQPRPLSAAGMPTDQEKLLGYTDALHEAGLAIDDVPMVQANPWDSNAAGMLLDAAPGVTAILSMSAMQGVSMIETAIGRGLTVPDQLSVVAYNDMPEAALVSPPLTTVDGMGREKGRIAAQMIFDGAPPRHHILRPELIVRASTTRVPA